PIPHLDKPAYWERPFRRPSTAPGMHRFVWDLREPAPQSASVDLPIAAVAHDTPRVPRGPLVVPGTYVVQLDADGSVMRRPLRVAMDPRIAISDAALREQYSLAVRLCTLMNESYRESASAAASGHSKRAAAFDALNDSAGGLLDTIDGTDAAPTRQGAAAVAELQARLRALQGRP
ncbi:MAG TPA: hypothetical protein VJP76_05750, partial [Candidatus Tumulicola sp.]|nr:hypothetical protein [Candidatus Tumulicola sp.]